MRLGGWRNTVGTLCEMLPAPEEACDGEGAWSDRVWDFEISCSTISTAFHQPLKGCQPWPFSHPVAPTSTFPLHILASSVVIILSFAIIPIVFFLAHSSCIPLPGWALHRNPFSLEQFSESADTSLQHLHGSQSVARNTSDCAVTHHAPDVHDWCSLYNHQGAQCRARTT